MQKNKGFSLVELLIVIAIIAILALVAIFQFSNNPLLKAQDDERKVEINTIADNYFQNAISSGIYRPLSSKIPTPPEGGEYQGLLSADSDSFKICAVLSKGKNINCLENSDNPNCYCRSSHTDNGSGNGGYNNGGGNPPPTPAPTVAPTSAPTSAPPSNPWGQAIALNGKPAYLNPPSYNPLPEYVKANFDPKMNLVNEQVTVEAWIKPTAPTVNGHHYRIVDNTYRLTMAPQPNNGQISYKYYFDVQSNENGPCGQTVVQSDPRLASDPWNINYYKTVSPTEFESWKHVAGVFKDSVFYIFENGILMNTYNTVASGHSYMTICNAGRSMHVGAGLFHTSTPYYDNFQGLIDEVRVSDIARYTQSFTRPTAPFTPDSNTDMLYHFDSNTNDASSNSLNGSITGTTEYLNSDIPF